MHEVTGEYIDRGANDSFHTERYFFGVDRCHNFVACMCDVCRGTWRMSSCEKRCSSSPTVPISDGGSFYGRNRLNIDEHCTLVLTKDMMIMTKVWDCSYIIASLILSLC